MKLITQCFLASLRQILATLLVGISLFMVLALPMGQLQAQAATLTPETAKYQVDRTPNKISIDKENIQAAEDTGDTLMDKIEAAADTVVEKLNLNEPISPSTKEFFNSVKENVGNPLESTNQGLDDAAQNVTGSPKGATATHRG